MEVFDAKFYVKVEFPLVLRLEQAGQPIGSNNLLIAAQVASLDYNLVTDNEIELCRIQELLSAIL